MSRAAQGAFTSIIHELSDVLTSSSDAGPSPHVENRMRDVAMKVVKTFLSTGEDPGGQASKPPFVPDLCASTLHSWPRAPFAEGVKVSSRHTVSVTKMLAVAFVKFPTLFAAEHRAKAFVLVCHLLPVLAVPELDVASIGLAEVVASLMSMIAQPAEQGMQLLVTELFQALEASSCGSPASTTPYSPLCLPYATLSSSPPSQDLSVGANIIEGTPGASVSIDLFPSLRAFLPKPSLDLGVGDAATSGSLTLPKLTAMAAGICRLGRSICTTAAAVGATVEPSCFFGLLAATSSPQTLPASLALLGTAASLWPSSVSCRQLFRLVR